MRKQWIFDTLESKDMLPIFGRYFFPMIIRGFDPVPECHEDLCLELGRRKDGGIIFPRGFAKSTWLKIDTIHDILYKLEPVVLYVGRTIGEAAFHFESIKSELENNELLERVYGNVVPSPKDLGRKWTNRHLETTTGINLVARGAGKGRGVNIKNQRPTKIVCDDIEDDDQVRSTDRCLKLRAWLYDVIFPSKDAQRGFIKMVGTVLAKHCEVLKFYNQHGGIFRKAIENGQSIWPNFWTLEMLEAMKQKIGTRSFSKEYMNSPVDEDGGVIRPQWVRNNVYVTLPLVQKKLNVVIAVDPQSGEGKGADFFGISAVGWFEADLHRYILSVQRGKGTQLEQATQIVKAWQSMRNVRAVLIEKVMTQVAVYQLLLDWIAGKITFEGVDNTRRNIPVKAVTPKGKDKVARLQALEAKFERGEVHVHHTMANFMDNLTAFPNIEHDDDVDAMIYALDASYNSGFAFGETSAYNTKENTGSVVGDIMNQKF